VRPAELHGADRLTDGASPKPGVRPPRQYRHSMCCAYAEVAAHFNHLVDDSAVRRNLEGAAVGQPSTGQSCTLLPSRPYCRRYVTVTNYLVAQGYPKTDSNYDECTSWRSPASIISGTTRSLNSAKPST
jgi:hypothetical protein